MSWPLERRPSFKSFLPAPCLLIKQPAPAEGPPDLELPSRQAPLPIGMQLSQFLQETTLPARGFRCSEMPPPIAACSRRKQGDGRLLPRGVGPAPLETNKPRPLCLAAAAAPWPGGWCVTTWMSASWIQPVLYGQTADLAFDFCDEQSPLAMTSPCLFREQTR
ncbi:hypothetical protein CABS03_06414 [Colletotrichum abscissum]|uniref:Uncharacterized protein n=1 Tax=Colletotrichum abscissum TaxID=1671311 RepID=A0A9P9X8Q5_9PEZI|nr:hypothetical protein CABS02_10359 [Colletotrichum abscissum]